MTVQDYQTESQSPPESALASFAGMIHVGTGEKFKVARPECRLAARFVDLIVVGLIFYFQFAICIFWIQGPNEVAAYTIFGMSLFFTPILYDTICLKLTGQTIGKSLFGLQVIQAEDGEIPSWRSSLVRSISLVASAPIIMFDVALAGWTAGLAQEATTVSTRFVILTVAVACMVLLLPVLLSSERLGWHDRVASTVVVPSYRGENKSWSEKWEAWSEEMWANASKPFGK